jgi:outer membrane protein assembly factor BamD
MKNLFYILLTLVVFSSCSEYQKALKSEDVSVVYQLGEKLYNEGSYSKANKLFEKIIPAYRGKPQAEKLMFLNADASFLNEEYYVSGYHFERFIASYPKSEKAEEAMFKSAKSYYELSPVYSKAQEDTKKALEKLQEFINIYPNSKYLPEANALVKELDLKLEKKAFEIALQYHDIAPTFGILESSIKALDNFILDFPGSIYREKALYYRLDSAYELGIKSVKRKKQTRLETAKSYSESFKKRYPNSEFIEGVNKKYEDILEELEKFSTKS